MVNVREYNDNDIEFVHDIVNKSFNIETNIEILKNNLKKENIKCNILELDNKVIGSLFLTYEEDIMKGEILCKIDYVAIDPNYRNYGYGKKLVKYTLDNLKDVDIIYLTSSIKRQSARHIYEEYGFQKKDTDLFIKKLK